MVFLECVNVSLEAATPIKEGEKVSTRSALRCGAHLVPQACARNDALRITPTEGCSFYKLEICRIFHILTSQCLENKVINLKICSLLLFQVVIK